jgi:hypothetical protein
VFAELQIRRPVVAAVCFGLYMAGLTALFGAAYGRPVEDVLFQVPVALVVATVVGAAVNRRVRQGLAGLGAEQVRRVVRWVRRGEVVDDPAVAESVLVYVRNQDQNVTTWGRVCLAGLTFSALSVMVTGDGGMDSALLALGLAGSGAVVLVEQHIAARRRRAAEAAARAVLEAA